MKPVLTCIWQVSGINNISFDQWTRVDLEYINNWSLLLDIKLLCLTANQRRYYGWRALRMMALSATLATAPTKQTRYQTLIAHFPDHPD